MRTNYTDANVETCLTYTWSRLPMPATKACPRRKPPPKCRAVIRRQFTSADVGAVGLAGSASYCGGQFTISGSGSDIWGTADAFQFVYVYVPVSTNCDLRAQVVQRCKTLPATPRRP